MNMNKLYRKFVPSLIAEKLSLPALFNSSSKISDGVSNNFVVYLLREKKLHSFLFQVDSSLSRNPKITLRNSINIDLPLTVISDNRIDNESELAEYFEDIIAFFEVAPAPSFLLLDPNYFYNMFLEADDIDKIDLQIYSPHIAVDTLCVTENLLGNNFWNLSFASRSLITGWSDCLVSTGSACAYIGSFFFPIALCLSSQYKSFVLIDIHNTSTSLLLLSGGKVLSKYLPFGSNQYLILEEFMADDYINRLSKSIVKFSSDNSIPSPKEIFYLSQYRLDIGSSRFFNLSALSDVLLNTSFAQEIRQTDDLSTTSDRVSSCLSLISALSLYTTIKS